MLKIFLKNMRLFFQYRPYWLKGADRGQMSFDIFVPHLKIAIEYQGKQHFEPIEFLEDQKDINCV